MEENLDDVVYHVRTRATKLITKATCIYVSRVARVSLFLSLFFFFFSSLSFSFSRNRRENVSLHTNTHAACVSAPNSFLLGRQNPLVTDYVLAAAEATTPSRCIMFCDENMSEAETGQLYMPLMKATVNTISCELGSGRWAKEEK